MKTSISLKDSELWYRFRLACMERRVVSGDVLEALIRSQLEQWKEEKKNV